MDTQVQLKELYAPVAQELQTVRSIVNDLWRDAIDLVAIASDDMPNAGGKLLRPALCLLSAGACGAADLTAFSRLAAAYESLHLASLTHDDVVDHASMRRGHLSLNALWDNHSAVLGGDYLVARGVAMLAEYGSCAVISQAVVSVQKMAESELAFYGKSIDETTREDCIALARGKTASLFAAAGSAPARLLKSPLESALNNYGESLGIAFQIIDDLIDVTQSSEVMGKPSCGDIVEGKATIPLLYLKERLNGADQERFQAMFQSSSLAEGDPEWIREKMALTGATEATLALARRYALHGQEQIRMLPDSPFRRSLDMLMELLLLRTA